MFRRRMSPTVPPLSLYKPRRSPRSCHQRSQVAPAVTRWGEGVRLCQCRKVRRPTKLWSGPSPGLRPACMLDAPHLTRADASSPRVCLRTAARNSSRSQGRRNRRRLLNYLLSLLRFHLPSLCLPSARSCGQGLATANVLLLLSGVQFAGANTASPLAI